MNAKLILISESEEDRTFSKEVSQVAGLNLEVFACIPEAFSNGVDLSLDVLFVDGTDPSSLTELEAQCKKHQVILGDHAANHLFFLSGEQLEKVHHLMASPWVSNVIFRHFMNQDHCATHYGRVLKAALEKCSFDIQNILESDAQIFRFPQVTSLKKLEILNNVQEELLKGELHSRIVNIVINAADEILMNALYDAPHSAGEVKSIEEVRKNEEDGQEESNVSLVVGHDENFIGVSVVDLFGSLDKDNLFERLVAIYENPTVKADKSLGRAGIGLGTILRTGGSLNFHCEVNQKTHVTVLFQKTKGYAAFLKQFKFISTLYEDDEEKSS